MSAALVHRGPDDSGHYTDDLVSLGVNRLSIIDQAGSAQPLRSADGSLVLVANAEIYNHVELRRQLVQTGHRFQTRGDCEVILHLYEEQGDALVHRLRGMFAFALWDVRRRRLLLARDRMGEKPLYLYESGRTLLFASELTSLVSSGLVPIELDPEHVDLYFHYQYVPEPRTPLRGVRKLPAAHILTVDADGWRVRERRYWHLADAPARHDEPATAIAAELSALAPLLLRSDVPVGVALSGGLDSSVVAALTALHGGGRRHHALSLGYQGRPANDERHDARALARSLGLEFHDVELGVGDVVARFPELVRAWDDPIADMTGFCYRAVAGAARESGIPVLLQGQGGDELFWGYPWVRRAMRGSLSRLTLWRALPDVLARSVGAPPGQLLFYDLDPDFQQARRQLPVHYGEAMRSRPAGSGPLALFTVPRTALPRSREQLAVEMTGLIAGTYLLENGIAQGDRLTMSHSVELRLPLVDHRLVETVIGLRKARSDHAEQPKHWLRQAALQLLPPEVVRRPKKPFSPPLRQWHSALVTEYGSLLPGGELTRRGILTEDGARSLARGEFPDRAGSTLTFKAMVLELWCRNVQRAARAAATPEAAGLLRRSGRGTSEVRSGDPCG